MYVRSLGQFGAWPVFDFASLLLLGLVFHYSPVEAAYVQWKYCDGGVIGDFTPTSLRAQLGWGDSPTLLHLDTLLDYSGSASCAQLLDGPDDVILDVHMLGPSLEYRIDSDQTCSRLSLTTQSQRILSGYLQLEISMWQEINIARFLPSFSTDIYLGPNKSNPMACISAEITPQLREDVSAALFYGPLAMFLFVLVSAILVTMYAPLPTAEPEDSNSGRLRTPKAILPGVGDCLQHLQLVFLTGSLTLRYPGFYQPVASHYGWAALFSPGGPITHGHTYPAVRDGIYEINGTLTGSSGLELMAQITGGPMTMDIWLNMVILALAIAVGTALLVVFHQVIPCTGFSSEPGTHQFRPSSWIKHTSWNVLKVILSYFVTPIVAISSYQITNTFLPAYHLALATLLIALLLFSFAWVVRSVPSRSLGTLVLDSSKQYRRVGDHSADTRDIFVLIFFAVSFARGATLGGLQRFPLVQIVLLASCELLLFAGAVAFRPFRLVLSIFTISCVVRFLSLILNIAFLPGLNVSLSRRSLVGYTILLLHATLFCLGYFVPAVHRLLRLIRSRKALDVNPEVHRIHQLRWRRAEVNDLSSPVQHNTRLFSRGNTPAIHLTDPSDAARTASVQGAHELYSPTPSPNVLPYHVSRLTRVERRSISPGSATRPSTTTLCQGPSARDASIDSSLGQASDDWHSTTVVESESRTMASNSPEPLGPRWSDYTFREVDLYYGRPQRADSTPQEANDSPQIPSPRPSVWAFFTGLFDRVLGGKGVDTRSGEGSSFQVIRSRGANVVLE